MLSEEEKQYCRQILRLLSEEDIFSLAKTSTNYAINVDNRTEAENAILAFTDSPGELMTRKKLTKGILLKYCMSANIHASAYDGKTDLIGTIIKFWAQKTSKKSSEPSVLEHQQKPNVPSDVEHYKNRNDSSNYEQAPGLMADRQHVTIVQNFVNIGTIKETYNQTLNFSNVASLADADQVNAEAFVKWFYELLNAYHFPAMSEASESFGPQHFWDNAELFLLMVTSSKKEEENIVGSDKVAERLLSFPNCSHILFNPNVNNLGVSVRSSHHGSKIISVCGTLHKGHECFGIFQQSFALVSNPLFPGRWKVKVTCLKMDQCPARTFPTLGDCQDIKAIEAHTALALDRSQALEPS